MELLRNKTDMYTSTSQMKYTTEQLILPLDLSIRIEENDPVRSFMKVLEGVNFNKYFKKNNKGREPYNPFMMIRVVLYAYMMNKRSVRDMEKACKSEIQFMWLAQENQPSHQAFQRFIKNKLTVSMEDIFHDINNRLIQLDDIDTETMLVDGTALEANANKFTFIWKKVALNTRNKTFTRLNEEIQNISKYMAGVSEKESWLIEDIIPIIARLEVLMVNEKIEKVYGKGKRKTPIQRLYDLLVKYKDTLISCLERIKLCGPDRNSCSKVDYDATFMHMKYDYYNHTGVFKAGYNIQIGVSDEYIMHTLVSQARSDATTFIPFFESYKKIRELPKVVAADAGYGSYDNYFYCLVNKMQAYIKYTTYRIEKTKKYKKKIYNKNNFEIDEEGTYICPQGHPFEYAYETVDKRSKYYRINETYECKSCSTCPVKAECTKSKNNRKIILNPVLSEFQTTAKEALDSEKGVELRKKRSAQTEGVFGIIKQDYGYERIQRRGIENVRIEILMVCIGFNLNKYHNKKMRKMRLH